MRIDISAVDMPVPGVRAGRWLIDRPAGWHVTKSWRVKSGKRTAQNRDGWPFAANSMGRPDILGTRAEALADYPNRPVRISTSMRSTNGAQGARARPARSVNSSRRSGAGSTSSVSAENTLPTIRSRSTASV